MPRLTELPAKSGGRKARDLYSGLNVLRTESKPEFAKLLSEIRLYIVPENPIEEIYVADIAHYTWEIMLYRRVKTAMLNSASSAAVGHILCQILAPPSHLSKVMLTSDNLAWGWLLGQEDKNQVSSLLQEAGFDESAIEAGAFRRVAHALEKADRMLNAAHDRRDHALRMIAKIRKSLAQQLRRNSDRVLAADEVPGIASDAEAWQVNGRLRPTNAMRRKAPGRNRIWERTDPARTLIVMVLRCLCPRSNLRHSSKIWRANSRGIPLTQGFLYWREELRRHTSTWRGSGGFRQR